MTTRCCGWTWGQGLYVVTMSLYLYQPGVNTSGHHLTSHYLQSHYLQSIDIKLSTYSLSESLGLGLTGYRIVSI